MSADNIFKIMIIDDNKSIQHDFIKILKTESFNELDQLHAELFGDAPDKSIFPQFEIDVASQGQEGVALVKDALEKNVHYSLVFVDIRMPPGWDGIETIKHLWELDKKIQIVICTAFSDYSWEETVAHLGKTDNLLILKKPFDNVSVRQLACALTTKWQLTEESRQYAEQLKQQVTDKTLSLEKSLSLVKSTFESSNDGILVVDSQGKIIDYNQKLIKMMQVPQAILDSESEEKFLQFLNHNQEHPNEFVERIRSYTQQPDEIGVDVLHFKNGKIFECYSQPQKLNEKIIGRILDFRDITKRAKLEQELKHQATHDSLTGLGNRVKLMDAIKHSIKIADENHGHFAVVFIDFDRFKLVNDSLSHNAGDELLKIASERLQSAIRPEDALARLGGDEFVIILNQVGDHAHIEKRVGQLLALFQQPFFIGDRQVVLTASVGVSLYPTDGKTSDILLRNADAAMYCAKARKGNYAEFYSVEMSERSLAVLDQEMELRKALINHEFVLCYQPEIDYGHHKMIAVEALIRWEHPQKGTLLPMDFIPLAEELGLIVPIGEWTIRTACAQNKAWQDAGFSPIRVAVNVSEQQFKQPDFVEVVSKILQETQLKPEYLEIELTENVIISSPEIFNIVTALKKMGVSIAIDDFGTGYSSLSYLHKIPLDRLKIDGSLIQNIHSGTDDEMIVRAVISMAKNLKMDVIAEGVETLDQLNYLQKNECPDVQGYYFSAPLNPKDIENYFRNLASTKSLSED